MKITYKDNPLNTEIELNEEEQLKLWFKIKIKKMENLLFDIHYATNKENIDLDYIKKRSYPDYYLGENDNERSRLDKETDEMFINISMELKSNHVGDCTCVPCSCMKCYGESLIGANTLEGLDKYSGDKIQTAFGKSESNKTIDEVINELKNDDCIPTTNLERWKEMGGYEQHIPRWKEDQKRAIEWLENYKKEKLNQ